MKVWNIVMKLNRLRKEGMIVDVVHKKIDVYYVVIFEQLVTRNHHRFI